MALKINRPYFDLMVRCRYLTNTSLSHMIFANLKLSSIFEFIFRHLIDNMNLEQIYRDRDPQTLSTGNKCMKYLISGKLVKYPGQFDTQRTSY